MTPGTPIGIQRAIDLRACPLCGAPAGEPCRTRDEHGDLMHVGAVTHSDRMRSLEDV
jgi:hypothetical protein